MTIKLASDSGKDTVGVKNEISQFGVYYDIKIANYTPGSVSFLWERSDPDNSGKGDLVVKFGGASILLPSVFGYRSTGTNGAYLNSALISINGLNITYYGSEILLSVGPVGSYRSDLTAFNGAARPDPADLTGGGGNDNLSGGSTDDTISGGDGDDTVMASPGNDTIDGGSGDDTVQFFSGRTNFEFREVGGQLQIKDKRSGDITTVSGVENLRFLEDGETLKLGDAFGYMGTTGSDVITGTAYNNILTGLAGDDTLSGMAGDDRLVGGDGNDTIDGGEGNDTAVFVGSASDYVISRSSGGLTIVTGTGVAISEGTDTLQNVETLYFQGGSQYVDLGSIAISGTSGNDSLNGTSENDTLSAGSGDDQIWGFGGYDQIDGGLGNDQVRYSGKSTDYRIVRYDDGSFYVADLRPGVPDFSDTVQNIESFYFAGDAVTLLLSDIPTYGTASADTITGSARADELTGFEGNDMLSGGDGADILYGDDGADQLSGDAGDDQLFGGAGNDILNGGTGNDEAAYNGAQSGYTVVRQFNGTVTITDTDAADGSEGVDTLTDVETVSFAASGTAIRISDIAVNGTSNVDTIQGGGGDDTIDGKLGDDILWGKSGNDIIRGDAGNDIIRFSGTAEGFDNVNGGAGTDTIQAMANATVIGLSQLSAVEAITANGFSNVSILSTANADTLSFSTVTLTNIVKIDAGAGNDNITGSSAADVIYGGDDNDTLSGGGGNDSLYGEFSNDTLIGGAGDDTLVGGWGNDIFQYSGTANGFDAVDGGQGTDTISALANSTIIGLNSVSNVETISAGSFTGVSIAGSANADTLNFTGVAITGITKIDGGAGNDLITGSDAADTILGSGGDDTLAGGLGNDVFQYTGAANGFDAVDGGAGTDTISALANSTVIGLSALSNVETISAGSFTGVSIAGSGNADVLNFGATTLTAITKIDGGTGNDVITGSEAADTILGSGGDDTLAGGIGNDVFQYTGTGNGFDAIDGGAGTDTISALANSTVIGLSALSNVETISAGSFTGVTIAGSANADTLNFSATTLTAIAKLDGGLGNDTITGSAAADTILGSGGDDILSGGGGNDIFQHTGAANGFDAVDGGAGTDTISALANSTVIGLSSVTGVETISAGTFTGVTIAGSGNADTLDFSAVTLTAITAINAGLGNDIVTGGAAADTNNGGDGNDTLAGGAGNDILNGDNNDDRLIAGAGNDTINGGAGIDTVDYAAYTANLTVSLAVTTAQTVTTGDADTISNVENVTGGSGADTLTGSTLVNVLNGGSGNDRLTGGVGNDTIIGGVGTVDIAVFAGLQASYTIATNTGVVTVKDNQATTDGDDGTDTISGIEKLEFKGGVQQSVTSPIVLNLDGNGVSLLHNSQTNVTFDWNQDGLADQTGWIGAGDAFLVCDRDGNGTVSGANELSFVDDKFAAKSDLDGLTSFDTNGDNVLSSGDADFAKFMVWQDSNGNGRADSGEVRSLRDAGIASIGLAGTAVNRTWAWGDNMTVNTGVFTKLDGTNGAFSDVALSYDSATTQRALRPALIDAMSYGDGRRWPQRSLLTGDPRFEVEPVDARIFDIPDELDGASDAILSDWTAGSGVEQTSQYLVEAMPEGFATLPNLAGMWHGGLADAPTEQLWDTETPFFAEAVNRAGQLAQAMATFGAVGAFELGTFDTSDRFNFDRIGMVDRGRREGALGERCEIA